MNSKITEGEWYFDEDAIPNVSKETSLPYLSVYAQGVEIIRVHGHGKTNSRADARAIAAVPDLIATLQEELDAIRVWLCNESNADITNGMFISVDKIKTALAKAGV